MSSTEPPSRVPPREGGHESKSAREELSSKGKVEKVREVDPDEETRKKKFLKYYRDEGEGVDETESEQRPSPFELYSQGDGEKKGEGVGFGASRNSNLPDVENAVIPGPSYSPPPNVGAESGGEEEENGDELGSSGALPQAEDFWEEVNLPDQPLPQGNQYQETSSSSQRTFGSQTPETGEGKAVQGKGKKKEEKKIEEVGAAPAEILTKKKKLEKEAQEMTPQALRKKKEHEKLVEEKKKKKVEQVGRQKKTKAKFREKQEFEEKPTAAPRKEEPPRQRRHAKKTKEQKEEEKTEQVFTPPVKPETQEQEFKGGHKREPRAIEIESPSTPPLPAQVAPLAQSAANQVTHYLHPTTVSLFYQMVGTIYVMQNNGVSRTEIVLNNPSYSGSKFFGSTITIEKYATAPDSFNIRLTGSNEAVLAFKENIPSLMTAFENSNLPFRVNRLDVEYSSDRPVFRRKEKQDRGEAGGGDLGEKRK